MTSYIVKAWIGRRMIVYPEQSSKLFLLFDRETSVKSPTPQHTIFGEPLTKWVKKTPISKANVLDRFSVLQVIQRLLNSPSCEKIIVAKVRE